MAQTVTAEFLHAMFRLYNNNLNGLVMPTTDPEEIDVLLNNAQLQIQGDEFRPHRSPDGKGFEMSKERTRNLEMFIKPDPTEVDFLNLPAGQPARLPLPADHRYTVSAKVSWVGLDDVFYSVNPMTHDEWQKVQQTAYKQPTYDEPAMVTHGGYEELLPVKFGYRPRKLRLWYQRLPLVIKLDQTNASNSVGMELPSWLRERLVQEAVLRQKYIVGVSEAQVQAALVGLTK